MIRTKKPQLKRTKAAKSKFPKPTMAFRTGVKKTWKPLQHTDKFPPWGGYACNIMKKIPATYYIDDLYKMGWACGDVKEYIETHWDELKKRKKKEKKSGRAERYKKKHYYHSPHYDKPNKNHGDDG